MRPRPSCLAAAAFLSLACGPSRAQTPTQPDRLDRIEQKLDGINRAAGARGRAFADGPGERSLRSYLAGRWLALSNGKEVRFREDGTVTAENALGRFETTAEEGANVKITLPSASCLLFIRNSVPSGCRSGT